MKIDLMTVQDLDPNYREVGKVLAAVRKRLAGERRAKLAAETAAKITPMTCAGEDVAAKLSAQIAKSDKTSEGDARYVDVHRASVTIDRKDAETGNLVCSADYDLNTDAISDVVHSDPARIRYFRRSLALAFGTTADPVVRATYTVKPTAGGGVYVGLVDRPVQQAVVP